MFDVKPVNRAGDVDLQKIQSIRKTIFLKRIEKKQTKGSELKMPTEKLIEERRQLSQNWGLNLERQREAPRPRQLRESDFKARAMQFNRAWVKKEQEVPHLIKSTYIPNDAIVPYADVVSKGSLPERYSKRRPIKRMTFEHSIESVLKRSEKPKRVTSDDIKKEIVNFSITKSPPEQYLEKKIDQDTSEKFEKFFGVNTAKQKNGKSAEPRRAPSPFVATRERRLKEPVKAEIETGKRAQAIALKKEQENFFVKAEKTKKEKPGSVRKKLKKKKGNVFSFFSNYKRATSGATNLKGAVARPAMSFALAGVISVLLFSAIAFVSYGLQIKEDVQVKGQQALGFLAQAQEALKNQDFSGARASINSAQQQFKEAENQLNTLGGDMLDIFSNLPFLSKISSGKNLVGAGDELTLAVGEITEIVALFSKLENPFDEEREEPQSMVDLFLAANEHITRARTFLDRANENVQKVKPEDLPIEYQDKFIKIKESLPLIVTMIDKFEQNSEVYLELLGYNGPRKYLFLFQNNQEMRATGGFIGSYGLLHINNGEIKNLIIDGIFNPDGQLFEDVIPPSPLQKISAGWSTHDANWYPHFPSSAHKIAWFYEKTGGPTVDGIITFTPTVMKKMLEVTGEIDMPEYGTSVNAENFIERTQFEVEIDFDKELNQPKKFIADLAPKTLNKLFSMRDPKDVSKVFSVMSDALKEKHILIYSFDENVQNMVSSQGWSGEILNTEKDFLMVINSNINGFKTDGVIDETISHKAEIMQDGSIIDTVKIIRTHNGGDSDFDWWNRVNSNYMRVYVPQGSQLITAKGHTREIVEPPLDYKKLKFEVHLDVLEQEQNMKTDENTGTRIYEEENKTVFANWVYVSPKETVEMEYQYLLPFKIDLGKNNEGVDTYSLLAQKQSGSDYSKFESIITYEPDMSAVWKYPEIVDVSNKELKFSKDLKTDQFIGIVFQDLESAR